MAGGGTRRLLRSLHNRRVAAKSAGRQTRRGSPAAKCRRRYGRVSQCATGDIRRSEVSRTATGVSHDQDQRPARSSASPATHAHSADAATARRAAGSRRSPIYAAACAINCNALRLVRRLASLRVLAGEGEKLASVSRQYAISYHSKKEAGMAPARRQMHLGLFWLGTGNHSAGWRWEGAAASNCDWDVVAHSAQIAERGKFDLFFISDGLVSKPVGDHPSFVTRLEPTTLIAGLAVVNQARRARRDACRRASPSRSTSRARSRACST